MSKSRNYIMSTTDKCEQQKQAEKSLAIDLYCKKHEHDDGVDIIREFLCYMDLYQAEEIISEVLLDTQDKIYKLLRHIATIMRENGDLDDQGEL